MKKICYFVLIIISIFIINSTVNAEEIKADSEWHSIEMNSFSIASDSTAFCSAENGSAKAVKASNGTYTCYVKSDKEGTVTVKYGEVGINGDEVVKGGATVKASSTSTTSSSSSKKTTTSDVLPSAGDAKVTGGSSSTDDGTDYFQICNTSKNPQLVASFKLVGIFITIVKIIVPVILIIMGSIDMSKAVVSKDNDAIQKSLIVFLKRSAAGVLVFLAPNIILGIFHLVDGMDNFDSAYKTCVDCILGSSSCPDVSFGNESSSSSSSSSSSKSKSSGGSSNFNGGGGSHGF